MQDKPIWIWLAGLVLVGLIAWALIPHGDSFPPPPPSTASQQGSGASQPTPTGDAVKISIANAATKQVWIDEAVRQVNSASQTDKSLQVNGKPIFVEVLLEEVDGKKLHYRSGTMVSDTVKEKIKPTVLSPGEESWILSLKKEWQSQHGRAIVTGEAPVLVRTPLIIAMWQSRAKALDCWPTPGPECTWERVRGLATSPNGWGMFGHPEWGRFKLGYGYTGESNSGTLSVVLMCMIGLNKTSGLTITDVDPANGCGEMITAVEKSKVHSGNRSSWLLDKLRSGGPEYLDAVITNEYEVIAFNRDNASSLREPLVAAYPQDGTMLFGQPFAILDGAPWVTRDQVEAAKIFQKFLLSSQQQQAVQSLGLRPADPGVKLGAPFEPGYGANPQARLVTLDLPDPLVINRIIEVWHKVKKHAYIALVFDKSGSMSGAKINAAVAGAKEFINRMDGEDRLIWMPFDDRVYMGTQGPKSELGEKLVEDIGSTAAGGGTALYDSVLLAYQTLEEQRKLTGDTVRYGLVILSDGKDTNSKNTLTIIEAKLQPSENDPAGIQIHAIAIGTDADEAVLKKIANSAHGRFWKGQSAQDMVSVYKDIATYY